MNAAATVIIPKVLAIPANLPIVKDAILRPYWWEKSAEQARVALAQEAANRQKHARVRARFA